MSDTGALRRPHPAPVAATRRRGARDVEEDRPQSGALTPRQGDIGYASLWVPDVSRAAAFYATVLGWEYEPSHDPRGRQVPAVRPPQGLWGGQPRSTLFCSYVVDDAAAAAARVRAAGGRAGDPIQRPYGLVAECTDDQGTRFAVHQHPAGGAAGPATPGDPATDPASAAPASAEPATTGAAAPAHDGDLAYITFEVADSRLARDFYGAVLDWRFSPGRIADGWQVEGTTPMAGLSGGHAEATTVPMWRVADLRAAVGRVRAAGGTATEPRQQPYGLTADCTDDQGTRFYLGQFPGE